MEPQPGSAAPENWKTVLTEGEEEEFREMIEPLTDMLVQSAKRDVAYYVQQDQLHENDLTPEEIAGETLYYAWEHRERRPEAMTLRGWLLGTQHRLLRGLVQQQQQFRAEKEVSLDAPVPPGPEGSAVEEAFWEWDQPTEGETTWEEVTPSSEPIDLEVPLHEQEHPDSLEAEDYHVLSMHDEFEMSLPEVAHTLDQSVRATAERLDRARASLHHREGDEGRVPEPPPDEPQHPDRQREMQQDAERGASTEDESVRQ